MIESLEVVSIMFLVLAATFLFGGLWIRGQLKKAEKQEKRADWSKVREWEDDDAKDDDDWGEPPAKS